MSRSHANNKKHLMLQKQIILDQMRKSGISGVLKVRFLFCKMWLASTNFLHLYQMFSLYEMKSFARALQKTDLMVSVPKSPMTVISDTLH